MIKNKILTFKYYPSLDYAITGEKGILKAIELCLKEKMYLPALIITYTGIDTMGLISLPKNQKRNARRDFIKWVEEYMKFRNGRNYPGKDLYSARCSMLHFMGGDSDLSHSKDPNKKTRIVSYAFGSKGKDEIVKEDKKHIIFSVELFINSFKNGVMNCLMELLANKKKAKIAEIRLRKVYNFYPGGLYELK